MIQIVNFLGECSDEGVLAKWPNPETELLPGAFYHHYHDNHDDDENDNHDDQDDQDDHDDHDD